MDRSPTVSETIRFLWSKTVPAAAGILPWARFVSGVLRRSSDDGVRDQGGGARVSSASFLGNDLAN